VLILSFDKGIVVAIVLKSLWLRCLNYLRLEAQVLFFLFLNFGRLISRSCLLLLLRVAQLVVLVFHPVPSRVISVRLHTLAALPALDTLDRTSLLLLAIDWQSKAAIVNLIKLHLCKILCQRSRRLWFGVRLWRALSSAELLVLARHLLCCVLLAVREVALCLLMIVLSLR